MTNRTAAVFVFFALLTVGGCASEATLVRTQAPSASTTSVPGTCPYGVIDDGVCMVGDMVPYPSWVDDGVPVPNDGVLSGLPTGPELDALNSDAIVSRPGSATATTTTLVVTTTTVQPQLYRARNGDTARGEIAARIYVERNVATAGLGDYDPDGDGWALVGRSNGDGDNGPVARWWLDASGLPQVSTRHSQKGCLWLTPTSLSKVSIGQTRLLATVGINTAQCRSAAPSADTDGDGIADDVQPLYRGRNGDPARTELAARVYVERNITASEAQIGVSDYDPDGDGWALVGRTNGAGDNGTYVSLTMNGPVPSVKLNHPSKGCVTITPGTLDLVARGQTRLVTITSTAPGTC